MRLSIVLLSLLAFVALLFVPAVPLHHLGDTSWIPVWTVYLFLLGNLRDASSSLHEILFCLLAIIAHVGFSVGFGMAITSIFSKTRKSN